jgi:hypothetical protein
MPITHHLQQLTARRLPGAIPQLFWHGTSSKNLRSILLYGLDPTKIKSGNWLVDPNVDENNPSKVSYGGIYFAKTWYTSYSYATSMARKDKTEQTHPLLIAVKLQELSTLPDEDQVSLNMLVSNIIRNSGITAAEVLVNILARVEMRGYNYKHSWRKYVEKFREIVFERIGVKPEMIAKRQDHKRLYGALDAVLLAGAKRYLAHVQKRENTYSNGYYYIRKALWDYAPKLAAKYTKSPASSEMVLPAKFKLPDAADAEQSFIKSADYAIKLLKNYARQHNLSEPWSSKNRTLRNLHPVGFHGRNKIVCILEFVDQIGVYKNKAGELEPNYERIQVHYGTLPSEFLMGYRELHSKDKPIIWLNKAGKQTGVDDPKKLLAKLPPINTQNTEPPTIAGYLQILNAAVI